MVANAELRNGKWQISGLRDPLAVDPAALLSQSGLNSKRVAFHWESYQALNPAIVLRRLAASLNPPPSVSLSLKGDTVEATGSVPQYWVERARTLVAAMPAGSPKVDLSALARRSGSGIYSPAQCYPGAYYCVRFQCRPARAGRRRHAGCCCRRIPPTDARDQASWFLSAHDDFRPRGCRRQRNGEPIPQRGSSRGCPLDA